VINRTKILAQDAEYFDININQDVEALPFSIKILLENLLRNNQDQESIKALCNYRANTKKHTINYKPARVLMQDFTGVPAIVDLAALRQKKAFENFKVVPPGTGICHQVNLEYLADVICKKQEEGKTVLYPDTLVGTDSHTTMINALCVLGWSVGGIEAEAVMLGEPISMLIPEVLLVCMVN